MAYEKYRGEKELELIQKTIRRLTEENKKLTEENKKMKEEVKKLKPDMLTQQEQINFHRGTETPEAIIKRKKLENWIKKHEIEDTVNMVDEIEDDMTVDYDLESV